MSATHLIGIPLAILGAVLMTFAAMLQHRGVAKVNAANGATGGGGLGARQILGLVRRPSWLSGTLLIVVAIVCQLAALAFAPLIVVQPIGVISLVLSALITAHRTGIPASARKRVAIGVAVTGVGAFVIVASIFANEQPITDRELRITLVVLGVLAVALVVAFLLLRARNLSLGLFYVAAGGMLYGFIATLAKVVISRVQQGALDGLTIACAIGVLVALGLGSWFVQTAYASAPPDLVVAGLTVIDPVVAVTIGLIVLQEASGAPWWALLLFGLTGVLAVVGVVLMARWESAEEQEASRSAALGKPRDSGKLTAASDASATSGGEAEPRHDREPA